jgi:3D (Asp-Asp-Asp) domain-containing protein
MEALKKKAKDIGSDMKCPKCDMYFSSKEELIEHGKTHVDDITKDVTSKLNL